MFLKFKYSLRKKSRSVLTGIVIDMFLKKKSQFLLLFEPMMKINGMMNYLQCEVTTRYLFKVIFCHQFSKSFIKKNFFKFSLYQKNSVDTEIQVSDLSEMRFLEYQSLIIRRLILNIYSAQAIIALELGRTSKLRRWQQWILYL